MPKKAAATAKTNKPADVDLVQQRLPPFPQNIPQLYIHVIWIVLGMIFLGIGSKLAHDADHIYEYKITYDDGTSSSPCYISSSNAGRQCSVTFTFDQTVTSPLYLYYELENFFQNHRRYFESRSLPQLRGEVVSESDVSLSCTPLYKNGSLLLNPCGLIANSYFTDVFTVDSENSSPAGLSLDETGISLHTDRVSIFNQVHGFQQAVVPNSSVSCEAYGLPSNCKNYYDTATGTNYKFYYPHDDTTQYLYESFPTHISPIEGVMNEHFIVWMRVPLMPTFRKPYGKIYSDFIAGDQLVINITANYAVEQFDGKKSLVISTLGNYGGKNAFSGTAYYTIGSIALIMGCFLFVKEKFHLNLKLV